MLRRAFILINLALISTVGTLMKEIETAFRAAARGIIFCRDLNLNGCTPQSFELPDLASMGSHSRGNRMVYIEENG